MSTSHAFAEGFTLESLKGNANVESSFTPLVGAERKRLQALLKAGKTKVDSDLLEKIKGQTLPEVEKNMARLMLIGGMRGDELEEYLVARHKLYGHVSLTWSAQPEMVQETIKKLGLAEGATCITGQTDCAWQGQVHLPPLCLGSGAGR